LPATSTRQGPARHRHAALIRAGREHEALGADDGRRVFACRHDLLRAEHRRDRHAGKAEGAGSGDAPDERPAAAELPVEERLLDAEPIRRLLVELPAELRTLIDDQDC
jgi:hypothetical protein